MLKDHKTVCYSKTASNKDVYRSLPERVECDLLKLNTSQIHSKSTLVNFVLLRTADTSKYTSNNYEELQRITQHLTVLFFHLFYYSIIDTSKVLRCLFFSISIVIPVSVVNHKFQGGHEVKFEYYLEIGR